jgi:putative sterol carrier protein
MATYAFLSPEWIEAARALRAGFAAEAEIPASTMRMNLTVEGVPYGDATVEAHVDTTEGLVDIELGHIDPADVKVTLDFDTARAVLIDNDAEIAMAAFMAGKVRIEGDMTKLLAYQSTPPTAAQLEVTAALREITAP